MDSIGYVVTALAGLIGALGTQGIAALNGRSERKAMKEERDEERKRQAAIAADAIVKAERREYRDRHTKFVALLQQNILIVGSGFSTTETRLPSAKEAAALANARTEFLVVCRKALEEPAERAWQSYLNLLGAANHVDSPEDRRFADLMATFDVFVEAVRADLEEEPHRVDLDDGSYVVIRNSRTVETAEQASS